MRFGFLFCCGGRVYTSTEASLWTEADEVLLIAEIMQKIPVYLQFGLRKVLKT